MIPDTPLTPREELEIQITSLLMGQLSPEEAAAVEARIAADPELQVLRTRLERAVQLLREARKLPETSAPTAALQLSKEKREKLLATFRGIHAVPSPVPAAVPVPPIPTAEKPSQVRRRTWVAPTILAASIAVLLGGTLVIHLASTRLSRSQSAQSPEGEVMDFAADPSLASVDSGEFDRGTSKRFSGTFREVKIDNSNGGIANTTRGRGLNTELASSAPASTWGTQAGVIRDGNPGDSGVRWYGMAGGATPPPPTNAPAPVATPAPRRETAAIYLPSTAGESMAERGARAQNEVRSLNAGAKALGEVKLDAVPAETLPAPNVSSLALSEPFSTSGKVNLDKKLAPARPAVRAIAGVDTDAFGVVPLAGSAPSDGLAAGGATLPPATPPPAEPKGAADAKGVKTAEAGYEYARSPAMHEAEGLSERPARRLREPGSEERERGASEKLEASSNALKQLPPGAVSDSALGGNPITAGNRSGSLAISANTIDALLLDPQAATTAAPATGKPPTTESRAKAETYYMDDGAARKPAQWDETSFWAFSNVEGRQTAPAEPSARPTSQAAPAGVPTPTGHAAAAGLGGQPNVRSKDHADLNHPEANALFAQDERFGRPAQMPASGPAVVAQPKGKPDTALHFDVSSATAAEPHGDETKARMRAVREVTEALKRDPAANAKPGDSESLFSLDGTKAPQLRGDAAAQDTLADLPGNAPRGPDAPAAGDAAEGMARKKVAADKFSAFRFSGLGAPDAVKDGEKQSGATAPAKPATAPSKAQEDFVSSHLEIRKADDLAAAGKSDEALDLYRKAEDRLSQIQQQTPKWQPELLDFRLSKTREAIRKAEATSTEAKPSPEETLAKLGAKPNAAMVLPPMEELAKTEKKVAEAKQEAVAEEAPQPKAPQPPPVPQPEVATTENAFSTFSLNVSDVSFQLAQSSLERGAMPEAGSVRSEEFINAFNYRDPEPSGNAPLAFAAERARYPFAHNRDLLRLSVKTAAVGREAGRPLNLVLLLDNSGSMERADRVRILQEALKVLAGQLQPQDKLSVITFSRTPRLWADGVAGDKAAEFTNRVGELTPQGGTDLSAAMDLGYQTALKHYQTGSVNRVVLLTDGAANLGNVKAETLKEKVETHRKQGVAFDCFGVGWEGYNDELLEQLSRNGDGRYGFINTPEEAATKFAGQLAGALRVAASDVKVQVEFNPRRVTTYRQIGYAKHQLKKEQFRDNTVDAAEIGAAEAGNALYTIEVNPRGEGDIATVRVRFKVPGTADYKEHAWAVPYQAPAAALEQASSSLRLAATAAGFSEWLSQSPFAAEVTTDRLLALMQGIPTIYGADQRPAKLEAMIRQAKSISGR